MKILKNTLTFISFYACICLSVNCNSSQDNVVSEKHQSRLKLNEDLSSLFAKNADPKYKHLLKKLDTVYLNDQKFRDVDDLNYLQKNAKEQKNLDGKNQQIVSAILDSFGYLNSKEVGLVGQKAINLTLLHSENDFKKKYLSLIETAFKEKRLFINTYASFIDKMLMDDNMLQKYGTQTTSYKGEIVYRPIDIDSMDIYRNSLDAKLDTTNYLGVYPKVKMTKSEYKKILPELIKLYNIKATPFTSSTFAP